MYAFQRKWGHFSFWRRSWESSWGTRGPFCGPTLCFCRYVHVGSWKFDAAHGTGMSSCPRDSLA
eukprot:762843-Pyramimonas_sp.AAC.1